MTIDEMAKDERQWNLLRDLILSGQVPASRIAELRREHPKFGAWLDMTNKGEKT